MVKRPEPRQSRSSDPPVGREQSTPIDAGNRVVPFRPRGADAGRMRAIAPGRLSASSPTPVEDIGRYQRTDDPDDYRHRMTMNALALVVCLGLASAGVWLANQIAEMRKTQDCVLTGRLGCAHLEMPTSERP